MVCTNLSIFGVSVAYSTNFSTDDLYDKKALQEYILYAGQHPVGGLRDKPPKYVLFLSLEDPYQSLIGMQIHIILFIVYLVFLQLNTIFTRLLPDGHNCRTNGNLNLVSWRLLALLEST
jgi:hypothetical protein